jgi:triosephosphate isomerase (TIM)
MTTYIIANWESHATLRTAEQWLRDFYHYYTPHPGVEVIVAPPFVFLRDLRQAIGTRKADQLALAAQDISPFPFGAYTGAVAAGMVKDLVKYVIIGHSSRRRYFHETHVQIANKASEAISAGITPILCVDSSYLSSQMAALEDINLDMIILAYEPYTGVGVTSMPSPETATKEIAKITKMAPGRPVLYAGPLKPDNAADYLNLKGASGLLVGSASLDPIDFATICLEAVKERTPA